MLAFTLCQNPVVLNAGPSHRENRQRRSNEMAQFHVTFFKSLLSSDGHQFKCPQQVFDLEADDSASALVKASRQYEQLLHLRDWRMRADCAEVSSAYIGDGAEPIQLYGSLWFRCPAGQREFYSGIDTDSRTLAGIRDMLVSTRCPNCGRSHVLQAADASLRGYSAVRSFVRRDRRRTSPAI